MLHPVNVFQSKCTRNLLDQAKPMDIFTLELTRHPDLNQIVKTQTSGSLSLFKNLFCCNIKSSIKLAARNVNFVSCKVNFSA